MSEWELTEAMGAIRRELDRRETERTKEANAAFVGRFFKYLNCYSSPGPQDRWWLYGRVTGLDEHGMLTGVSFERDKDGKIFMDPRRQFLSFTRGMPELWVEIQRGEFVTALNDVIQELCGLRTATDKPVGA